MSFGNLPSVHLFLPISNGRHIPAISSVFPTSIVRRDAVNKTITVKISDWVAGASLSGTSAVCAESGSRTDSNVEFVKYYESIGSAVLSFSFTALPIQCNYRVNLQVSLGLDSWNLNMRVDVLASCVISTIIPSSASVAGGQHMRVVVDGFPVVAKASDVRVEFSSLVDSVSRSATDVSILWSSEEGA